MEEIENKPNMTFMVYKPESQENIDKTKEFLNGKSFLQLSIKEILEIRGKLRNEKDRLIEENPFNL